MRRQIGLLGLRVKKVIICLSALVFGVFLKQVGAHSLKKSDGSDMQHAHSTCNCSAEYYEYVEAAGIKGLLGLTVKVKKTVKGGCSQTVYGTDSLDCGCPSDGFFCHVV